MSRGGTSALLSDYLEIIASLDDRAGTLEQLVLSRDALIAAAYLAVQIVGEGGPMIVRMHASPNVPWR